MSAWRRWAWIPVLLLLLPTPALAGSPEAGYQRAAAGFHRLKGDATAKPAAWRALAETFLKIHAGDPSHTRGADGLFSAALASRAAFRAGGGALDLSRAVAGFRKFVRAYPTHRLADDSLVHLGDLLAGEFSDPQGAHLAYGRVLAEFPNGDQAPLAAQRITELGLPPQARVAIAPEHWERKPAKETGGSQEAAQALAISAKPGKGRTTATLKRLQYWSTSRLTRVTLTTDVRVNYDHNELPGQGRRPPRVYFDLHRTQPGAGLMAVQGVGDGVLEKIRVSGNGGDKTRVVFDLKRIEKYSVKDFPLLHEKKIVIDFFPRKEEPVQAGLSLGSGQAFPESSGRLIPLPAAPPSLKSALGLKVGTVVIDAGHGGRDPGAVAFGLEEKDVALRIAHELVRVFARRRPDIRVFLTREDDVFIPLDRRPLLAKQKGADLFLSIHLNANKNERFSGIESYFLNLTSDASALQVAARENATTEKNVGELTAILRDLLRDTNILESSKLARTLHAALVHGVRSRFPVRDLGVKQAPFMVLIGAEMPSVLVEAGFLTNRRENRRLRDSDYLELLAESIFEGLRIYIREQKVAQDVAAPRSRANSQDS